MLTACVEIAVAVALDDCTIALDELPWVGVDIVAEAEKVAVEVRLCGKTVLDVFDELSVATLMPEELEIGLVLVRLYVP